MGVLSEYEEALRTAARHAAWAALQEKVSTDEATAIMLDRRRNFLRAGDRLYFERLVARSRVTFAGSVAERGGRTFFESIIEDSDLLPLRYLELGLIASRAVGRLRVPSPEQRIEGFATGFLVAPNVLLTNQHVLRSPEWARGATVTMDAEDGVDGTPRVPRVFRLDPARLYVADADLDFCFVAVAPFALDGTPLGQYGWLRLFAETGKIVRDEYATIVQHPNGRQKHLAARNNRVSVYVYDQDLPPAERPANSFLYYQTDTLKGSSGSPVLSDQWYVIALHRRGVPATTVHEGQPVLVRTNGQRAALDDPDEVIRYVSNEGVRISHVLRRLDEIAGSAADRQQVAAQLAAAAIRDAAPAIEDGPVATHTATYAALHDSRARTTRAPAVVPGGGLLEISRRNLAQFPEDTGYDEDFLPGFRVRLPRPTAALRRELAPRIDRPGEYLLPFRHFTTAMHARRRVPVFAAVNIDGAQRPAGPLPKPRPSWSYDPRIDEAHQPDDSIFSPMLQRGHLAAREYVYWGGTRQERTQADVHSFTLTNVCPQIDAFNGRREWYEVERLVMEGAKTERLRVTEFVGPVLRARDPDYDSRRGPRSTAGYGTRIRIPLRFWKIILWVEDGSLWYRAFILDQREELDDAGPLEFDVEAPDGVRETTIDEIAELTDLEFDGL